MSEKVAAGQEKDVCLIRRTVYIHAKSRDRCKEEDQTEGLRLYPTKASQCAIECAVGIKACKAELLYTHLNVVKEHTSRGFYTADVRFYYRVTAEAVMDAVRSAKICGLVVFCKRNILYANEGNAKRFSRENAIHLPPTAMVETSPPIVVGAKLTDACCPTDGAISGIPLSILTHFGNDLSFDKQGKQVYVTLNQRTTIRLERETRRLFHRASGGRLYHKRK